MSSDSTASTQPALSTNPTTEPETPTSTSSNYDDDLGRSSPPLGMIVTPFGVSSGDLFVSSYQLDVETDPGPNDSNGTTLSYELQLGLDMGGRGGVLVAPEQTSDEQIALEVNCEVADWSCRPERSGDPDNAPDRRSILRCRTHDRRTRCTLRSRVR